jgi:hypothetical protein
MLEKILLAITAALLCERKARDDGPADLPLVCALAVCQQRSKLLASPAVFALKTTTAAHVGICSSQCNNQIIQPVHHHLPRLTTANG